MPRHRRLAASVLCRYVLILTAWIAPGCGGSRDVPKEAPAASPYAGSQSCRECHERFYALWSTSHHGLAMQPFTAALATTRLRADGRPVVVKPYEYVADPAGAELRERGPDGNKRYAIAYAIGGKNVFYFLTPLERGRLQVLPLAYDVHRQEWFDMAASALRHDRGGVRDSPLSWKEPAYTFNTSCFNCHVSQLATNYDPASDSYRTTWAEPGINCETCHGPGAGHIQAARQLRPGEAMRDPRLIVARTMTPAQTNALCGSCHAKLSPLTASFTPGNRFYDHFGLATFEDADFYPDGRDLGENFTMTTWGLSACAQSGQLDCVHCHTSSGRYRFRTGDPNAACLPCHAAQVKSVAAHSHHPAGSSGARCVACHMPMTEFARMRRSDHSMRPPAPAATIAFQSPNACTICHRDRSAPWAEAHVRTWHAGDYRAPALVRRAGWIAALRGNDCSKLPAIVHYLSSPEREEVWSASLLRLLGRCTDDVKWRAIVASLGDKSPLVRAAAVEAMTGEPREEFVRPLLAAARDDYRLVRVRAAAALSEWPLDALSPGDRAAVEAATHEYQASLLARRDDFGSRYNLANFYLGRREFQQAIDEFTAAARLQPHSLAPLVNRALAYAALGQQDRAEASLRQALAIDPADAAVNLNLGMLLAEQGRLAAAEEAFRTAFTRDPQSAPAAYNLGVMLAASRPDESLQWCRRAVALRPRDARYGYTLGYFLDQRGQTVEAIQVLERVIRLPPDSADVYVLLAAIYTRLNRPADARRIYRAAIENPALPPAERRQLGLRPF